MIIFRFFAALVFILTLISCGDEVTNIQNPQPEKNYFPDKTGSTYQFAIAVTDSSSGNISGVRNTSYSGDTQFQNTNYKIQIDSVTLDTFLTVDSLFFRKSSSGLFYYVDTTGFSAAVDDSLEQFLAVDSEIRALFFPLNVNQSWPSYRIDVSFLGQPVFSIINISAKVLSLDSLNLNLNTGSKQVEAFKIEYKMLVRIDQNLPATEYLAYGWVSEEIGFVKWEGDSILLTILLGGGLNLGQISGNISQTLVNYSLP